MTDYKYVIILHTYFHARQIKILDFVTPENSIVYYSSNLQKEVIENELKNFALKELPVYEFSMKMLKDNIIIFSKKVKNTINNLRKFIKSLNIQNDNTVILFTEKDLFNQVLLEYLENVAIPVKTISVDEGIGHYRRTNNFLENFKNAICNLFGLIFLNFKFNYVVALGHDERIDEVYLRFPELVNEKNYKAQIKKINTKKKSVKYTAGNAKKVLLFTSPLSEDGYYTISYENKVVSSIISVFKDFEYTIDLKPHPREKNSKYSFIDGINLIDQNISFENLKIDNYHYIINFGSSIVLDLYEKSFPLNKVITYQLIDITKYPLFNKTILVQSCADIKSLLNL